MNRLAVLEKLASSLRLPPHCEAYAKRSASDALEVVVAYGHEGKRYFCVAAFLDEWSDRRFTEELDSARELPRVMRSAIRRGLPE